MMKNHEFQELVDRDLSGLIWDEQKRTRVLYAIHEEEKTVRKFSATLILIAAILCLSVTALAAGLLFFPRIWGGKTANAEMERKYDITGDL